MEFIKLRKSVVAVLICLILMLGSTSSAAATAAAALANPPELTKASVVNGTQDLQAFHLKFSGEVSLNELKKSLRIVPSIGRYKLFYATEDRKEVYIKGGFSSQLRYLLSIEADEQTQTAVVKPFSVSLNGPGALRVFEFLTEGMTIEKFSQQLLQLKISRINRINCRIIPLHPLEMLEETLAEEEQLIILKDYPEFHHFYNLGLINNSNKPVEEVFQIVQGSTERDTFSLPLTFRDKPSQGGIYRVELRGENSVGEADLEIDKLIQITDIGITWKRSPNQLLIWTSSLRSATPIPNLNIYVVLEDQAVLFAGKTDSWGLLNLKDQTVMPGVVYQSQLQSLVRMSQKFSAAEIKTVIAVSAEDQAVQFIDQQRLTHLTDAELKKFTQPTSESKGFLFTERGIYQPGEPVYFKALVREYEKLKVQSPGGEKIQINLRDPGAQELYAQEFELNEFGTAAGMIQTETYFRPGTYNLSLRQIYYSDDGQKKSHRPLFTRSIQIQEFERPRHYLKIDLELSEVGDIDSDYIGWDISRSELKVSVDAEYYAGGPVKNSKIRWIAELVPINRELEDYQGFVFGNQSEDVQEIESGEAYTDHRGNFKIQLPVDSEFLNNLHGIRFTATCLDVDSRPATASQTFYQSRGGQIGIKKPPINPASSERLAFNFVVLDDQARRLESGEIMLELKRQDWFYNLKRDSSGQVHYNWERMWIQTQEFEVPVISGQGVLEMVLPGSGTYLLKATYRVSEDQSYSSQVQINAGWHHNPDSSEIPSAGQLFLLPDKYSYSPGETVVVDYLARRPLNSALITLEGLKIYHAEVIPIDKLSEGRFSFMIPDIPFEEETLSITMIAQSPRQNFPAYQFQNDIEGPRPFWESVSVQVNSEQPVPEIEICFSDPEFEFFRPGEKVNITVKALKEDHKPFVSEIACWAVDKSVLDLTGYKIPDFSELIKQIPFWGIISGESRLGLINQDAFRIISELFLTGGGDGEGLITSSYSLRKDFNPVVFFYPQLATGDDGEVQFEIQLPDNLTTYRVFAAAIDKFRGITTGFEDLTVQKPYYISPVLPRFLVLGDEFSFQVDLFNQTREQLIAQLEIESESALEIEPEGDFVNLEPGQSERIVFEGKAQEVSSDTAIKFYSAAGSYQDGIQFNRRIISPFSRLKLIQSGSFIGSTEVELPSLTEMVNNSNLPGGISEILHHQPRAILTIDRSPITKLMPAFQNMIDYPYGCLEQISSRLIAISSLRPLVKSGLISEFTIEDLDGYLRSGVNKLLKQQLSNGGFVYWPGNTSADYWGSLYAVIALSMISSSDGNIVPEDSLKSALKYLRNVQFGSNYLRQQQYSQFRPFRREELVIYALASNNEISQEELIQWYNGKSAEAVYLICENMIDPESRLSRLEAVESLLKRNLTLFNQQKLDPVQIGFCLKLGLQYSDESETVNKLLNNLAGELISQIDQRGLWKTTDNTGLVLQALSEYIMTHYLSNDQSLDLTIPINWQITISDTVKSGCLNEVRQSQLLEMESLLNHSAIKLSTDSSALLSYTVELDLPEFSPLVSEQENKPRLEKYIENLRGNYPLEVGDIARITIIFDLPEKAADNSYQYLCIDDPLPAGLEAINSVLAGDAALIQSSEPMYYWMNGFYQFHPDYEEFHTDRVLAFRDYVWNGSFKYQYYARATTSGSFTARSTKLFLMYQPDFYALTEPLTIKILPQGE